MRTPAVRPGVPAAPALCAPLCSALRAEWQARFAKDSGVRWPGPGLSSPLVAAPPSGRPDAGEGDGAEPRDRVCPRSLCGSATPCGFALRPGVPSPLLHCTMGIERGLSLGSCCFLGTQTRVGRGTRLGLARKRPLLGFSRAPCRLERRALAVPEPVGRGGGRPRAASASREHPHPAAESPPAVL